MDENKALMQFVDSIELTCKDKGICLEEYLREIRLNKRDD